MLKTIAAKILEILLSKPLQPQSSIEAALLLELQADFKALPCVKISNVSPSEAAWLSNMNRLRELVLTEDPRSFLRWDVVTRTMFIAFARYLFAELKFLKERSDWDTRWRIAVQESLVGHPMRYLFYPASSGNLLHHAYHVAQFEEKTKIQANALDFVFEFGGGYGSMCRLFFNLGFKGTYVIFDLPSFSSLQRYYLNASGLPVQSPHDRFESKTRIKCVSDIHQLKTILGDIPTSKKSLFLATWSISEAPIGVRDAVLPLVADFQSFLIAYQDRFEEMNNIDFFENWKDGAKNINWHSWRMEHTLGNSYLIGSANNL